MSDHYVILSDDGKNIVELAVVKSKGLSYLVLESFKNSYKNQKNTTIRMESTRKKLKTYSL